MLKPIGCGDFELNLTHPHGTPTLVPSVGLEQQLDLRNAAPPAGDPSPAGPLAVHLHVHYLDTLPLLLEALLRCRDGLSRFDLWISTDRSEKASVIRSQVEASPLHQQLGQLQVRVCSNRGRNLGPLLNTLWPELRGYALLLHLHGKRSLETDLGESWRQELLHTLLPESATVADLRRRLNSPSPIGLVMPQPPALIRPYLNWGNNFELAAQLAGQLNRNLHRDALLAFPAGMMFWCQPAALEPLAQLCAGLPELPPEPLAVDGTSLHALERLVAHSCEQAGYHWRMLCREVPTAGHPQDELSVWRSAADAYLQATALMAAQLREEHSQRICAETNLQRCSEQLDQHIRDTDQQLQDADQQLQTLMAQVSERDQRLEAMARSLSWRLTRPLRWRKRPGPAGT